MLNLENYYANTYKGSSIPLGSFEKYSKNAYVKVKYYTSNRIDKDNLSDEVKDAICEISELLCKQEELIKKQDSTERIKSNETVGPHSVSYVDKSSLQSKRILTKSELDSECYKICLEHLAFTGLMNRGF